MASTFADYDNTVAALKACYGKHKSYALRRDGQREAVEQLVQAHGLVEDGAQGGWVQCTASIGFGWSVYEAGDKAVLHYRDGGMGWDRMLLLARDRAAMAALRQTGLALGLVKARKKQG